MVVGLSGESVQRELVPEKVAVTQTQAVAMYSRLVERTAAATASAHPGLVERMEAETGALAPARSRVEVRCSRLGAAKALVVALELFPRLPASALAVQRQPAQSAHTALGLAWVAASVREGPRASPSRPELGAGMAVAGFVPRHRESLELWLEQYLPSLVAHRERAASEASARSLTGPVVAAAVWLSCSPAM